ncbi:MAG: flavin reductase [Candidatus Micrarchaeota archaeon]|nr:flavin reductase [Candidatus Micrarchaeota archaeon]
MDLERMNDAARKFVTNVGLITSNGPIGDNIMSAEWTHHISYSPGHIMINLRSKSASTQNILETGEFGVNIAGDTQNVVTSVAGRGSGRDYNKIAILKELGVEFYRASNINVLMVKGAAMNVECKVIKHEVIGDHIAIVGEVVNSSAEENVQPLLFHGTRYFKLGEHIAKPDEKRMAEIDAIYDKNRKTQAT